MACVAFGDFFYHDHDTFFFYLSFVSLSATPRNSFSSPLNVEKVRDQLLPHQSISFDIEILTSGSFLWHLDGNENETSTTTSTVTINVSYLAACFPPESLISLQ